MVSAGYLFVLLILLLITVANFVAAFVAGRIVIQSIRGKIVTVNLSTGEDISKPDIVWIGLIASIASLRFAIESLNRLIA